MSKRTISFLLVTVFCLTLFFGVCSSVKAEDYFTINIDVLDMDRLNSNDYVATNLSSQSQGVSVRKYLSDSSELAVPVRLTLLQMDSNAVLFDKDYGYQSGTFDSGVIYLPYVDNNSVPYLVTLYVADYVYAMPFIHLLPRLEYNGACTSGIKLRDVASGLSSDWLMGTMIDLNSLRRSGNQSIDICASNSYIIGQATVSMQGNSLTVDTHFFDSANVQLNSCSLYVITNCSDAANGASAQQFPTYSVGQSIDVSSASSALLYMPMQVSYNSTGLSSFSYSASSYDIQNQLALWQSNQNGDSSSTAPTDPYSIYENQGWVDDSGSSDDPGWGEIGWGDDSGWDDDSGWSDNSGWESQDGWSDGSTDDADNHSNDYDDSWADAFPANG